MEAAKEDTIPHYLPILDDLVIQRINPREGLNYITDLCILFYHLSYNLYKFIIYNYII